MECLMDSNFNYRLFVSSLLLGLGIFGPEAIAQGWVLQDSIRRSAPHATTQDLTGRLYLADEQGAIVQYGARGDSLRMYHPVSQESPTLLPWQLLRIQAYYPFQQTLKVLDQNLAEVATFQISETILANAALSTDQHLWYISSEWVLHKYQPILEQTVLSASLQWYVSSQSTVHQLQEYQNRLYIHVDDAMIVFDLFGNYLYRLPVDVTGTFHFFQDELYYLADGHLIFINLYSKQLRQLPIPPKDRIRDVLTGDNILYTFTDQYIYLYRGQIAP